MEEHKVGESLVYACARWRGDVRCFGMLQSVHMLHRVMGN
jgi:hypothetical protein